MATPSKKAVAKVPAKKAAAPAAPVAKKETKPRATKSSVKLLEFSVTATIPTQQYGNIMPKISVVANTIEEARATVMPIIEELYKVYAEKPRDGRPSFEGSKVTETVKEIVPVPMPTAAAPAPAPTAAPEPAPAPKASEASDSSVAAPEAAPAPSAPAPKSEFAQRAEKMIGLAMTEEAAEKIRAQIEKSEKIPEDEKPELLSLVEAKITDFQSNVW